MERSADVRESAGGAPPSAKSRLRAAARLERADPDPEVRSVGDVERQPGSGQRGGPNMIVGAHSIIYSMKPEADRAFLRDVLGLPHVDVGEGWLIFGLPPAEVAVHPSESNDVHEFYLMCDDVGKIVAEMGARGIATEPVQDMGWGILTQIRLPGGGKLGVYQPRHERPKSAATKPEARKKTTRPAGKSVKSSVKARPKKGGRPPARKAGKRSAGKAPRRTPRKRPRRR